MLIRDIIRADASRRLRQEGQGRWSQQPTGAEDRAAGGPRQRMNFGLATPLSPIFSSPAACPPLVPSAHLSQQPEKLW